MDRIAERAYHTRAKGARSTAPSHRAVGAVHSWRHWLWPKTLSSDARGGGGRRELWARFSASVTSPALVAAVMRAGGVDGRTVQPEGSCSSPVMTALGDHAVRYPPEPLQIPRRPLLPGPRHALLS